MKLDHIILGITSYFEQEIAAPAPSGLQKFGYYALLPFIAPQLQMMASQYSGVAQSLEILSTKGEWDIDKLHTVAKDAIKKTGSFPFMGIIVRDEDIEKLFVYISKTEGGAA